MLLIPVFFGCETQSDLGIKYDLGSDASVKFVEFTLPATNIYIDSLRTDDEGRILVGKYVDPLTGTVSAEGYFNYFYQSGPLPKAKASDLNPTPLDTLKIDSLVLFLESNEIISSNPSPLSEFTIHELEDTLKNNLIYLSRHDQTVNSQIGSFSRTIDAEKDTIFRVRLDATYASDFYDNLSEIAGDPDKLITSSTFKSIGISPKSTSECLTLFSLSSDTTKLVVYSSPISPNSKDTTYLTYFGLSGKNYSFLARDFSSSEFNGIVENQNFDLPSEKNVLDPLMGLSTAFSLEPLKDFFDTHRKIIVNNASVFFEFESQDNRDTLVFFRNYFRKSDNKIFGPAILSNPFGNIVMSDNAYITQNLAPADGFLSSEKDKIHINSTLFFQQVYKQSIEFSEIDDLIFINPTNGTPRSITDLVLISPIDVTLKRTIIKNNGIKLRLYYTEVDQ